MTKIYCPKCGWKPGPDSRWICMPGCGFSWNTFDTCGQCPGCGKVWLETECLACAQMSPHHEWSHDDTDINVYIEKMMESKV